MAQEKVTLDGMKFVNPYDFVSSNFKTKSKPKELQVGETLFSGVIHCEVRTRTPIAIPNGIEKIEQVWVKKKGGKTQVDHLWKKFVRFGNQLVIPASSLRGPLRSVYEAVTDSCYATTPDDAVVTIRSSQPFQPGILRLEDGTWNLYKAKRCVIPVSEYKRQRHSVTKEDLKKIKMGTHVYFDSKTNANNKEIVTQLCKAEGDNTLSKEGILYVGEYISGKKFESVFEQKQKESVHSDVLASAMKRLEQSIGVTRDEKVNKNYKEKKRYQATEHSGYQQYEEAYKNGVIPLWYKKQENGTVYLSMACIGRFGYQKTMGELLQKKAACKSKRDLCKACALFGFAEKGEGIGSRIRVTDATLMPGQRDVKMGFYTLQELSSPKPSYMPFYLKKPKHADWSYDSEGVFLRGRKFYWHWDYEAYRRNAGSTAQTGYIPYVNAEGSEKGRIEKTDRNSTMELVNPGTKFQFKIYCDGITPEELKELIWTITLGENDVESKRCHKIGHGKPLGLGSVKITIRKIEERKFEQNNYECSDVTKAWVGEEIVFSGKDQLLNIVDMDFMQEETVRYPYVVEAVSGKEKPAYSWFMENFKLGSSPKPKYVLPDIPQKNAEDAELPSGVTYEDNVTNTNTAGNTNSKQTKGKSKTKPLSRDALRSGSLMRQLEGIKIN